MFILRQSSAAVGESSAGRTLSSNAWQQIQSDIVTMPCVEGKIYISNAFMPASSHCCIDIYNRKPNICG